MKSESEKAKIVTRYRRYSDHPVVLQKLAKAKEILDKADLSFLETSPKK